jgi:hypothetical protein
MATTTEKLFVSIDGEVREMNTEEKTQFKKDQAEAAKIKAEEQARETAKASAKAKLAALGLTAEEIAAL